MFFFETRCTYCINYVLCKLEGIEATASAFVKKPLLLCSTLMNLLVTFECWTSILEEGFGLDVIYLDYRKAFDTVPHQKLLQKLRRL